MRTPGGLIPSRFLLLLLPLILVSCSGGGSEAPPSLAPQPSATQPPAPAGLLYRTDTTLVRSQTDGSGKVTLEDAPGLDLFSLSLTGSTVVYQITALPVPGLADFGLADIWQVQTNGTEKRAVVNSQDAEIIRDVFSPWVVYENAVYANNRYVSSTYRQARLDGSGQGLITDANAVYRLHVGTRTVFVQPGGGSVFSVLLDGTDERTIAEVPNGSTTTFVTPVGTLGTSVIISQVTGRNDSVALFTVPVTGGAHATLVEGPDYSALAAVVGARIVYSRCAIIGHDPVFGDPIAGPCDLYSALSNGTGTVALATTPDNETVQGVIGSSVIVRRNGGATDRLYSLPVGGGAETFMLTLDQNEFVSWIVGDRVILERTTGLWSLKADGSGLVQLTSDASDRTNQSTGPFICFARGPAAQPDLWCVPVDGSRLATQVATGAYFVNGL